MQHAEHDYRDVLLKAASLVEEGWCQGDFYLDETGKGMSSQRVQQGAAVAKSCAVGAIHRATWALGASDDLAVERLSETIPISSPVPEPRSALVSYWNDEVARTADEVAETMRKAAGA